MEIKITLQTSAGPVVTTFTPVQIEMALQCIRSYVADGKVFTVHHQASWA